MIYLLLILFFLVLILIRKNLLFLTFFSFFGIFHIIPVLYGFLVNGFVGPLGVDNYGLKNEHVCEYLNVLVIFCLSILIFNKSSHLKINVNLFGKRSFLNSLEVKLFVTLFVLTFSIELASLLAKTLYVLNNGYQELHVGDRSSGRNIFQIINHYLFLILLYYGLYIKNSIVKILFYVYIFASLFTGMRMPSLVLFLVYELYYNRSFLVSKKLFYFLPLVVFLTFFVQNFRVGATTEFNQFGSLDGLGNTFFQLFSIFGFTNEILYACIVVKLDGINIGYTNFLSDILNVYYNLIYKFSNGGAMPMELRANSGNLSYQISKYFFPDEFLINGVTAGGSSLADVYFYFGYIGIFFSGFLYSNIVNYLNSLTKYSSFSFFVIYFTFTSYFLKSFRDGAISFFFNGMIDLFFILIIYYLFILTIHRWRSL